MTLQEAIEARHSVRAYKELPLAEDVVKVLKEQIAILNNEGNLHIQLNWIYSDGLGHSKISL